MNTNTLKNIGAILAGFLTVVILSILTDAILNRYGLLDTPGQQGLFDDKLLALAFAYRSVYTIVGGYVAAMLSASNRKRNIIILGTIGTIAGILGVIGGWNLSHHWYPIALAIFGFPCILLGYKLFEMLKK